MSLNKIYTLSLTIIAALSACGGNSENIAPPPITVVTPPVVTTPPGVNRPAMPEAAPDGPSYHPLNKGWELIWSDEFDGPSINTNNWNLKNEC